MSALFAVSCHLYSLQGHRPWLSKGASNLLYTDLPSIQAAPWGELPPTVPLVTPPPPYAAGFCRSHGALGPAAGLVCKLVLIELALFSHRGWWRQDVAT